jgi:hypothetical protein
MFPPQETDLCRLASKSVLWNELGDSIVVDVKSKLQMGTDEYTVEPVERLATCHCIQDLIDDVNRILQLGANELQTSAPFGKSGASSLKFAPKNSC